MNEKYSAFFNLYTLGNILGFHNGLWIKKNTMMHYKYDHINEYVSDFIELGGINGIDIKKWIYSDNVSYLIAMSKAMLKYNTNKKERFLYLVKNELIRYDRKIKKEFEHNIDRIYDRTTMKYIETFTKTNDGRFTKLKGVELFGNYASLRNIILGLQYNKKKDLKKLVNYTYLSTVITHNSVLSFLSSIILSYFVSLAVQEIPIKKWPSMLINLLESKQIKSYVGDDNDRFFDYLSVVNTWKKYIDSRFDKNGEKINVKSFTNLIFRMRFYYDTFLINKFNIENSNEDMLKRECILLIIISYDSLLDCDGYFEKLLFYSAFVYILPSSKHIISSASGALYGLVYGFGDVPKHLLENIEDTKELTSIGNKIFTSYY